MPQLTFKVKTVSDTRALTEVKKEMDKLVKLGKETVKLRSHLNRPMGRAHKKADRELKNIHKALSKISLEMRKQEKERADSTYRTAQTARAWSQTELNNLRIKRLQTAEDEKQERIKRRGRFGGGFAGGVGRGALFGATRILAMGGAGGIGFAAGAGVTRLLGSAVRTLNEQIKDGIRLNAEYQTSWITLSGFIVQFTNLGMSEAISVSKRLQDQLSLTGSAFGLTIEQSRLTVQAMASLGTNFDTVISKFGKVGSIVKLLTAGQPFERQIFSELRALIGLGSVQGALLTRMALRGREQRMSEEQGVDVKLTTSEFTSQNLVLLQQGKLWSEILKDVIGLEGAASQLLGTYEAQKNMLVTQVNILKRTSTGGLFGQVSGLMEFANTKILQEQLAPGKGYDAGILSAMLSPEGMEKVLNAQNETSQLIHKFISELFPGEVGPYVRVLHQLTIRIKDVAKQYKEFMKLSESERHAHLLRMQTAIQQKNVQEEFGIDTSDASSVIALRQQLEKLRKDKELSRGQLSLTGSELNLEKFRKDPGAMRMYANELKMIEILEEQQDTLIETLAIYETIEEITGETTLHEQDVLSSKKSMKDIELQILKIKEEGNKRSSEALAVEKRLSASQVSVLDNYRQFNSQFLSLQERRDALINRRVAVNRTLGEKFGMTFEDVLSGKTPGPSMDPEKQIEKLKEFEILQGSVFSITNRFLQLKDTGTDTFKAIGGAMRNTTQQLAQAIFLSNDLEQALRRIPAALGAQLFSLGIDMAFSALGASTKKSSPGDVVETFVGPQQAGSVINLFKSTPKMGSSPNAMTSPSDGTDEERNFKDFVGKSSLTDSWFTRSMMNASIPRETL